MAKVPDELKRLNALYKNVFSSPQGEKVLDDLIKRFYDSPLDGADLNREVGRRDVVHYIFQKIENA